MNEIYYSILRTVIIIGACFIISTTINRLSYYFDTHPSEKSKSELFLDIVVHIYVIIASIYFIRNILFKAPYLKKIGAKPLAVFAESTAISLIYFGTQFNLQQKIQILFNRVNSMIE